MRWEMYCCKNNDPMKTAILTFMLLFTLTCYGQQPGEKLISTLGGVSHYSSTISKQHLLNYPVLTAIVVPNDASQKSNDEYKISSAKVTITGKMNGENALYEFKISNTNVLSADLLNRLQKSQIGDKIFIEEIKAESKKDGTIHTLPIMLFTIE
jgi:hypothetical protein